MNVDMLCVLSCIMTILAVCVVVYVYGYVYVCTCMHVYICVHVGRIKTCLHVWDEVMAKLEHLLQHQLHHDSRPHTHLMSAYKF